ncbi:hypothetical protein NE865_01750 [Phthorimaea operculella]|nr:hypothetical protein NE865_01750 [Phthorimaea operculella]
MPNGNDDSASVAEQLEQLQKELTLLSIHIEKAEKENFFLRHRLGKEDPPEPKQFRAVMADLSPVPASRHGSKNVFLFKDLDSCSHVFLRLDSVKPPLTSPYSGPHAVVSRTDKTFTIIVGNRTTVVSIDRVKPAYIDTHSSQSSSHSPDILTDSTPAVPTPLVSHSQSQPLNSARQPSSSPHSYITRSGRRVRFAQPFGV